VHLITPIPATIARPLIKGLGNEVVVRDDMARRLFPAIELLDYETSVRLALAKIESHGVETSWSDALTSSQGQKTPVALLSSEGMIIERRQRKVPADSGTVFLCLARLGGDHGWLYLDWTWQLRGMIDRLCGGVGMRRGRRDPENLRVGDAVDFWRVEALEPGRLLRLRAEMRVPGKAWLEFQTAALSGGTCMLTQTAFFAPKGLLGLLYWYMLYPVHSLIFGGLIRRIASVAALAASDGTHVCPESPVS
jgi:hypothetical protein